MEHSERKKSNKTIDKRKRRKKPIISREKKYKARINFFLNTETKKTPKGN